MQVQVRHLTLPVQSLPGALYASTGETPYIPVQSLPGALYASTGEPPYIPVQSLPGTLCKYR